MDSSEPGGPAKWKWRGFVAGLLLLLIVIPYLSDLRVEQTISASGKQPSIIVSDGGHDWVAWTEISAARKTEEVMIHSMVTPGVSEALHVASLPAQVAQKLFVTPEPLSPGTPAMSLIQMMNPTQDSVEAAIRPRYEEGAELCSALRMAAVTMEGRSHMVVGGSLRDVAEGVGSQMSLRPGELHNLALLVSVPVNLSNEYQGKSCNVDFMLESTGISR